MITDRDLRFNYQFVHAFETLRKRQGHREMDDAALRDVSESTGIAYEAMRVARHLRNALAHDDPVNRESLLRHLQILAEAIGDLKGVTTAMLPVRSPSEPAVRAYRVHAWKDPRLEQEMIANGFVSIGGEEVGDLTDVRDPERIRSMLTETMPDRTANAIGQFVGYWRRFPWDADVGHFVVLPTRDGVVAIGEFVGPYYYVANAEPHARHRREVAWIADGVSREGIGSDLLSTINGKHTVQEFKSADAAQRLRTLAETGIDPGR